MSNMPISKINKLSQLFQPVTATIATTKQTEIRSKSYENLLKYGLIKQVTTGMYAILPLGLRIFNKLTALVDNEMQKIGAQKLLLPALTPTHLWKKTDRLNNVTELFKIQDRAQRQYILSPTHEESICSVMSTIGILSPKMLPLKLYQISNKWRDEIKPRFGFLRSREFMMKDLYTFDINLNNAQETYALVCNAYENIFKKIGITYIKSIGDPGLIGDSISHEYHYISDIGEDIVCICPSCQYSINKTICKESYCPKCKNAFNEKSAAEVGHTFLLNTKYTIPLEVKIKINNESIPLVMGCFGLGLSRIFTVMTELLSTKEELRWPKNLAPYTVCLIPPKAGSKEENKSQYVKEVMEILNQLNIDTILDDRTNLTIGKRFMHARITGFPYVIIIGKSIMNFPPLIEIHNINNSTNCKISLNDIPNYFNNEDIKI
ncbi:proline--tRNA ligase, mitochondrial isoform X1 [Apis mellifera caucasica]|uniref:proline--tRNA ligase n=3 Tax=Apis mellifera TaxID=7460 RepID=A0A7M7GN74_APIME|nr:probable proline--tRNA ligase, mitochondrial isoform X1 [Apis mellifera]KAG6795174.1 proline--tRNA ligase, mitochondrial isoform X1 [Apis mellifera caucasica]KAG9428589.1 proline--tRNA ligase, mitochondrial isoform X1 [Apis mellifera carnica]|eukprot:XP_006560719.1 probable proline--tRNA ligase, mitochondrial isoform X1 [Apis mellifera]